MADKDEAIWPKFVPTLKESDQSDQETESKKIDEKKGTTIDIDLQSTTSTKALTHNETEVSDQLVLHINE